LPRERDTTGFNTLSNLPGPALLPPPEGVLSWLSFNAQFRLTGKPLQKAINSGALETFWPRLP